MKGREDSNRVPDIWCGYCGKQDFVEIRFGGNLDLKCIYCEAIFEDNPGYGYFTASPGKNNPDSLGDYSLNTGQLLDSSKLPRTPEGIVRNSGSKEELEKYLLNTQIK